MKSENQLLLQQEPCKVKWSAMHEIEGGKFCDLCNKKVYDFKDWDKADIINKVRNTNEEICGRLNTKVLDSNTTKTAHIFHKFKWATAISSLIVLLISTCKIKRVDIITPGTISVCNSDTLYTCEHKDITTFDYAHKPNIHEPKYKGRRPCEKDQDIDDTQ